MLVSLKPLRTHGHVKIISNASINLQKSKAYKHNYEACVHVVCGEKKVSCAFRLLDILRLLVEATFLYQLFTSEDINRRDSWSGEIA